MVTRDLSLGMTNNNVRALQASLQKRGSYIPPTEIASGFFGPATRQAVLLFQQSQALPMTGIADQRTTLRWMLCPLRNPSLRSPLRQFLRQPPIPAKTSAVQHSPVAIAPNPPSVAGSLGTSNGTPEKLQATAGPPATPHQIAAVTGPRLSSAMLTSTAWTFFSPSSSAKNFINDTVNTALKTGLASTAAKAGQSGPADLVQSIRVVDIATNKGLSVQQFVSNEVKLPDDPAAKAVAIIAIVQLSTNTTIGDLVRAQ